MPNKSPFSFKNFLNFLDNNFAIIVIIIAVFIFGFAFGSMWKGNQLAKSGIDNTGQVAGDLAAPPPPQQTPENVPPVTESDHVYGASNPKVTIIEYSDFGCPFCARVHPTLKQLTAAYPDQVTWVYRHYLLGGPSSLTGVAAQMSECIAQNQGNDKFWQFITEIYQRVENDNRVADEAGFYALAANLGVAEAGLRSCVESEQGLAAIEEHLEGAQAVGIGGTPALVIVSSDGQFEFVAGAVPYESLEETVKKYF